MDVTTQKVQNQPTQRRTVMAEFMDFIAVKKSFEHILCLFLNLSSSFFCCAGYLINVYLLQLNGRQRKSPRDVLNYGIMSSARRQGNPAMTFVCSCHGYFLVNMNEESFMTVIMKPLLWELLLLLYKLFL